MPAMKVVWFAAALVALALPLHSIAQTEVAPGVTLSSPVSAVEQIGGQAKVEAIHPSAILSNAHTGSNLARGLVYANQHNTVELAGLTSSLVLTSATPTFYVRVNPDDPNNQAEMLTLVHLKPTKDTRIVFNFTANVFGGSRKRHVDIVPVEKTQIPGDWLRVVPKDPLPPGEYGLIFLPQQAMLFPDMVFDFSIAPK